MSDQKPLKTKKESYEQLCILSITTKSNLVIEFHNDLRFLNGGKQEIDVNLAKRISQHVLNYSNNEDDSLKIKVDQVMALESWSSPKDVALFLSVLDDYFHSIQSNYFLKSISLDGRNIFHDVHRYEWTGSSIRKV